VSPCHLANSVLIHPSGYSYALDLFLDLTSWRSVATDSGLWWWSNL